MNIFLDLTTSSDVFNPTSPQGQWIFHRFGKRFVKEKNCSLNNIKKVLSDVNVDTVFLKSFYGDSFKYPKLHDLCKYLNSLQKVYFIFGYTPTDIESVKKYVSENARFYIDCAGLYDLHNKVFLNSSWGSFEDFCKVAGKYSIIEFHMYEHNIHQVPEFLDLCVRYNIECKLSKGVSYSHNIAQIIDESGEWLYDIAGLQYEELPNCNQFIKTISDKLLVKQQYVDILSAKTFNKQLYKSVGGKSELRKFRKLYNGKNIIEKPKIIKNNKNFNFVADNFKSDNNLYLSCTGHLFNNKHIYEIYSNALAHDWEQPLNNYIREEINSLIPSSNYDPEEKDIYVDYLLPVINRLADSNLGELNVSRTPVNDVLKNNLSSFGYRYV